MRLVVLLHVIKKEVLKATLPLQLAYVAALLAS